jgi:hypothetical protein
MASGSQLAMGRVVGSLCVVTAKDEDASSAMLASWISQASFDPPGLTIAVKKDRAIDDLLIIGNKFNVSMVPESGWRGCCCCCCCGGWGTRCGRCMVRALGARAPAESAPAVPRLLA